jgi:hypothetical protein
MLVYAATRKGASELRSHALNYVATVELGESKLDYSEVADIKTLPYVDYNLFVKYNIKDTLLQLGIERRTCDIDNVYQRCYYNATSYEKIFRQTVFLKSRAYLEYYQQGFIIGNNPNIIYGHNDMLVDAPIIEDEDDEDDDNDLDTKDKKSATKNGFAGAIVADPKLNNPTGIKLLGRRSSYIFDDEVDFDYSSMYPNTNIAFNISPNTMYGKVIMDKRPGDGPDTDMGKDFLENLPTGNFSTLGSMYLGLPKFEELYVEFEKELKPKTRNVLKINKKDAMGYNIVPVKLTTKKG